MLTQKSRTRRNHKRHGTNKERIFNGHGS